MQMNMNGLEITIAPQLQKIVDEIDESNSENFRNLILENIKLQRELETEKRLRIECEKKIELLSSQLSASEPKKVRKRKLETTEEAEYSEYKSDGKRKARPAESIRSYDDFVAMQNYFLSKSKVRDWALWTIGVSLGLRISDLLSLRICDFLNEDLTFKNELVVIEQKTQKENRCVITESVVDALTKYFDHLKWKLDINDYLFKSSKTKGKMYEEYGWKILSDAGKALNLPINIGSHTMRKSFANIAACVDKSSIDMNAITKIQGLLNHSDQRITMKYLGTYQAMFDKARVAVSDFVLGKSGVNELVAGNSFTIDDIMNKIDSIESKINNIS